MQPVEEYLKSMDLFQRHIRFKVNNSEKVQFRVDKWCSDKALTRRFHASSSSLNVRKVSYRSHDSIKSFLPLVHAF